MITETARFLVPGSVGQFREGDVKVLALDNGQFDIAFFQDRTPATSYDTDVRVTRMNADGTSATNGVSVAIKAPVDNAEADASLATLGTLQAVAFTDRDAPGSNGAIRLNFYDKAALTTPGGYYGRSVLVDGSAGDKYKPEVAALEDGRLAVAYVDGATHSIKARVYSPALGDFSSASFTVSTTPTNHKFSSAFDLGLTALSGGDFAVSWLDEARTSHLRVVREDGAFATADIAVAANSGPMGVTELDDGTLAVSYTKNGGAYFQTFDPEGKGVSAPVAVTDAALTVTTTALQDGRVMVGYTSASKSAVVRIFEADGMPDGEAVRLSGTPVKPSDYAQIESLATLADGRVAASYSTLVGGDVYSVILDPREEGVSLHGTGGADQFVGTRFDDTFRMGSGNDIVSGGGGNDYFDGGKGADRMTGGAGNDTYVIDNKKDVVVEAAGGGTDTILTRSSFSLYGTANIENVTLTGKAAGGLTGDAFDNVLTGNAGNNSFQGGGGSNTLIGGAGNDTYYFATAMDRIVEAKGGGTDTVYIGGGTFTLAAGVEVETIAVLASKAGVTLTGNEFGQTLSGNTLFANFVDGKGGADILAGGSRGDTFSFTAALGAGNVDHIARFGTATGAPYNSDNDSIRLGKAIFAGLAEGGLSADAFARNDAGVATDASDRIIYETDTGNLYYDSNGAAAGGRALFAVVDNRAALTAGDFFVG